MLDKVPKRENSFQVSIGEDGAVITYCKARKIQNKLFVRSTSDADTEKLRQLLNQDKNANIYLYIDTLDQSYVQRSLPAVSAIGIAKVAKRRLEREIPKDHLKACVQLGKAEGGRKDWVYVFISASLEPPVSTWIDFFMPYPNIIKGIYFLPVELYTVVKKLRKVALKGGEFTSKQQTPLQEFLTKFTGSTSHSTGSRWELFISHNKSGGFRQVAYQDGKIVFARLLNNINDPAPDVIAGNIEQEIANSLEYLTRLSLEAQDQVDIYLVLSKEIQNELRTDKLKASHIFMYTPFEMAQKLNLPEAATDKDRFADPPILAAMARRFRRTITMHTPVTGRVYNFTRNINIIGRALTASIPVLILIIGLYVSSILHLNNLTNDANKEHKALTSNFSIHTKEKSDKESEISDEIDIAKLNEIIDLYKFLTDAHVHPINLFSRIGQVTPQYARVKVLKWGHLDPQLYNFSASGKKAKKQLRLADKKTRKFSITSEFEVIFRDYGTTFEELNRKYLEYADDLVRILPEYRVEVSELPANFTFSDINKPVPVIIKLTYPKKSEKKR